MTTTEATKKARYTEGPRVVRTLRVTCKFCGDRLSTYRNRQGLDFTTCPRIIAGGGFHTP